MMMRDEEAAIYQLTERNAAIGHHMATSGCRLVTEVGRYRKANVPSRRRHERIAKRATKIR